MSELTLAGLQRPGPAPRLALAHVDSTVWKDAAAAPAQAPTAPTAGLRWGAGALAARLTGVTTVRPTCCSTQRSVSETDRPDDPPPSQHGRPMRLRSGDEPSVAAAPHFSLQHLRSTLAVIPPRLLHWECICFERSVS
ncbi:unnamed protein product [Pleuronectes platessa]|uniref:Uncharacterized protein n=1 Tax=Pleuronectes platessa TaxID=8262 RepID=A0A9N7ZDE2_PLEPL|nr:unnamed protein product [Pleuronectes platessa]